MGIRQSRRFKEDASIEKGEFFILGGQIVYVAEVGEEIKAPNGATDEFGEQDCSFNSDPLKSRAIHEIKNYKHSILE